MIEGGETPCLSSRELEIIGFKMCVFALSGLLAATKAIGDCLRYLKEKGTTTGLADTSSFEDYREIIGINKYQELEEMFIRHKPPGDEKDTIK